MLWKHFLVCSRLSNDDVGVGRGTVFQEIRPGVGFKTGKFRERKDGYRRTSLKLTQLDANIYKCPVPRVPMNLFGT